LLFLDEEDVCGDEYERMNENVCGNHVIFIFIIIIMFVSFTYRDVVTWVVVATTGKLVGHTWDLVYANSNI